MTTHKIAFIGLGNMGGGMAANQAKAGHSVAAFDLSEAALERARTVGCSPVGSVAEAVKHADVDDAFLSLVVEEESVVAAVRDEGPGFDPASVRPDRGRHVGLGLLRERARLSGGGLDVESALGEGTVLRLRLPRSSQVAPGDIGTALPRQRLRPLVTGG